MNIVTKKLSDLVTPEKNVRIHTDKQLQEYEKSVRMFGQIRPIVIDEKNIILAGRGLYDTLKRMGMDTAECYQYMNLTENQKKKLMIADNKIFSLGIENLDTLNEFLVELRDDLDIPGFDEEILRQMVADADEVTEKISEYGTLDETEIRNIRNSSERMEQRLQPAHEQPAANIVAPETAPVYAPQEPSMQTDVAADPQEGEEPTEIRRFVICPNCGEKIWL